MDIDIAYRAHLYSEAIKRYDTQIEKKVTQSIFLFTDKLI